MLIKISFHHSTQRSGKRQQSHGAVSKESVQGSPQRRCPAGQQVESSPGAVQGSAVE